MDNKQPNDNPRHDADDLERDGSATDTVAASDVDAPGVHAPQGFTDTPFEGMPPVVAALAEQGEQDDDVLNTDNLSADEIASLELTSFAEDEGPPTSEEEVDATEMISADELDLDQFSDVELVNEPPKSKPILAPKLPALATKTPETKPPVFGGGSAPNPFLRPKLQGDNAPKRTLLGMKAPTGLPPSITPPTPRPPQPEAPAPGSGASALAGRAMNFGAEHAFSSTRMPQPAGLPLDPLSTSGHLMPTPASEEIEEDFDEAEATAIYQGEPSSPQLEQPAPALPSFGVAPVVPAHTPPPQEEFQEAEATLVAESPSTLNLDGEDLDDDFAEQKTEVIQSPFEQEAIMPKLRVAEGPMAGQEFILTGLRSTIGRGNNNSVVVEDLAMSRLHFEIIRNSDDSYLLRDLGSANGTALNGTRVKEAVLYNDDRMEAGKSIIVFEHAASMPRPNRHMVAVAGATLEAQPVVHTAPPEQTGPDDQTRLAALQIDQSTRMFTRVAIGAGLLCIPLCFLLIIAITSSGSKQDTPDGDSNVTQPVDDGKDTHNLQKAAELYLEGAEATKSRSWDDARQDFEKAKALNPALDITPQLDRIEREKEALQHLEEARAHQDAEKIIKAAEAIPKSSVYHDDAQKLIRLNRQDGVTILHQKALALFGEDKIDEAEAAMKELAALSPDHQGIPKLEEDIKARREAIAKELEKEKQNERVENAANDLFPDQNTSSSSSNSKADLKEGYSLYKSKKFSSASKAFKKAGGKKGKSLAKYADTVASQWKAGSSAISSSKWSTAIKALEKARSADRRINKAHRKAISKELAQAYGNAGLAKLKAKDYRQARKYLASGEKLGVSESSLSKLSRGLEDEAKKIYVRAVNKKKSDPDAALQLCRKIMLMVPSSSSTYKKAQKLIFDL